MKISNIWINQRGSNKSNENNSRTIMSMNGLGYTKFPILIIPRLIQQTLYCVLILVENNSNLPDPSRSTVSYLGIHKFLDV